MDDLKKLYFRIENPMDNKLKWNKLLNIYSTSYNYEDFYARVTKKEKKETKIQYDIDDKKTFCLAMWSIWKSKILSIKEDELRTYIENKEFDYDIYDVIKSLRELESVKTYTTLQQVLTNQLINRYFSDLFDDFNHKVVICSDFSTSKDASFNTILTIKVDASRLYKLLKNYINECIIHEIPYYIKYTEFGKEITLNFYTKVEHFRTNEKILSILKKENYLYFYDNYDLLSGNINEAISIRNKDVYNTYQYLRERSLIFFKSIDSVTYEYLVNHLTTLVSYKDGRMTISDYLATFVMERVVNQLVSKSIKTSQEYFLIANSEDLLNLKKYIKEKLSTNMKDILKDRLYLKNSDDIIPLKLNDATTIKIEIELLMSAIRNLTLTLISKDGALEKAYRVRIKNECQFFKVDFDKFCLDSGFSKKLFFDKKRYDSYQEQINKINQDIKKVESFENLLSQEINLDTRNKIADSMTELRQLFNIEEGI